MTDEPYEDRIQIGKNWYTALQINRNLPQYFGGVIGLPFLLAVA